VGQGSQDFILGYFRFLPTGDREADCREKRWPESGSVGFILSQTGWRGNYVIFAANAFFFAALGGFLSSN
jgi:hypothetical protein